MPPATAADQHAAARLIQPHPAPPGLRRRDDGDERSFRVAPRVGPPMRASARRRALEISTASAIDTAGPGAATGMGTPTCRIGDRARGAAAPPHALPEMVASDAVRRDDADARDRNARPPSGSHPLYSPQFHGGRSSQSAASVRAAFAWGGALAFASSLIFFAYSYVVLSR